MAWTDTARRQHMRKGLRYPSDLRAGEWALIESMFFKGAGGQTDMHGSIGRPQETGNDRGGSDIHGLAPLGFGHSGGLPLVAEINGEVGSGGGSDGIGGPIVATPCARRI